MKKLFLLLFSFGLMVACTPAAPAPETTPESAVTEEGAVGSAIYGHWLRTAVYADGALVNTVPADLIINADGSYQSSSAACATSGSHVVTDNTIAVTMTQSGCPGNIALPYNVTYTFTIAEDNQSMSWTTANAKEDYVRVADNEEMAPEDADE